MKTQQQNEAIAKALGWTISDFKGTSGDEVWHVHPNGTSWFPNVPNFTSSLDAMHEAEKTISYWPDYLFFLREIVGPFPEAQSDWSDYDWKDVVHATAEQRAEAFLRTKGLWTE